MLSAERNALIVQTGAATPTGALMRRYWQPAALVEELAGPRPAKRVTLLGEELVLFRNADGTYGLLDRHCAHRGADLSIGRIEDGGLRCPFHGWLFAADGRCLEQPAEPEGSTFCQKVRQKSYPCVERSGIIFAYMGDGDAPAFPAFDCFNAPEEFTFAFKGLMACNWLQALEVGIDPAHASFLHRFFDDEATDDSYGKQFRAATVGADIPMTRILRDFPRPEIAVETTDYGMRLTALRRLSEERTHVRITNLAFPHAFVIPMSENMTITQWHVPIDDTRCYWYAIFTSFTTPVDKTQMRDQRLELYALPDYVPRRNAANDYGYSAEEQATQTYTGLGQDINVHDSWAVESMGAIQDRTKEHLGQTDKAIIAYRKMLFKAIDAVATGAPTPMVPTEDGRASSTGPMVLDGIAPTHGWWDYAVAQDAARRHAAPWFASGAPGAAP